MTTTESVSTATTGAGGSPGPYADDIPGYRDAVRAFIATPALDTWRKAPHIEDVVEENKWAAPMLGVLWDGDIGRYGYSPEIGGLGGDVRHWAVLYDELARADITAAPQHGLITTMGQPIWHWAPELAKRFLPAFAKGEEMWGQGFSEPEAGSDMASMRCRARLEGDHYVVSGQKIWTSHGESSSRIMLLCRTGTPESRHRGLSMLFLDSDSPGLTIRPIELASGRAELAECFFDDVHVPVDRLMGEEGQGWAIAMYLLQFERAVYAWQRTANLLFRLRALAASVEPTAAAQREIGSVYLNLIALRARSVTTVRRLAAGETVGPEASADKLMLGATEQTVYNAARSLLGSSFAIGNGLELAQWREEWWYSRTTTIYGGSAEVQRGIIADRVLNLPKG